MVTDCKAHGVISIHAPRVGSDAIPQRAQPPRGHFNPRSPCGERHRRGRYACQAHHISIHAPRVGSDGIINSRGSCRSNLNPRSPCGERLDSMLLTNISNIFQSTLPVWGATQHGNLYRNSQRFQSTLPVWGATSSSVITFSISLLFQSTLPVWGATSGLFACRAGCTISIHAPRVGSDLTIQADGQLHRISIHAPRVGSDSKIAQFFACNFAQK